ncbi:MAG: PaaI family thioesterase [Pseudomonadota bacterium]
MSMFAGLSEEETLAAFNARSQDHFPGFCKIHFTRITVEEVVAEIEIERFMYAPNGYLHAGVVVTLADTVAGYGTVYSLPQGASGFTTIELKSNFLSTAKEGGMRCVGRAEHRGSTTQVWDCEVSSLKTGRKMALFRCSQMILYPKPKAVS